jgi:adenine-specific DNA-methyltransferase
MRKHRNVCDSFEEFLRTTAIDLEILLPRLLGQELCDFYLNPRYLRGSDFLMRWSQGRWAEDIVVRAINATGEFWIVPVQGDSRGVAGPITMISANPLERIVGELADKLATAVNLPTRRYDDRLTQWIAFHGLEGTNITTIVAHQAALNLILKGLICHLAGSEPQPNPASVSHILVEADAYFQRAGWGHLPHSCLDDLALQANVAIDNQAIAHVVSFLKMNAQQDVIGALYSKLVPQDARRSLGQFWTPASIAEFMTQWAVQETTDRVLDPAFGSGIFLLAAIERLVSLGESEVVASRQVAGVELSPLVFLMGVANVLLRYPQARPSLHLGDFVVPQREPLEVLRETPAMYSAEALQLALPGLEPIVPKTFSDCFDAIVCNPPYTRHHRLPEAYKATWGVQMEQQFGLRLSRFSSLFAYFLVQATRMLKPTGRMAFITPAVVFEASYSRQVKEFILRHLRLRAIITFHESLSVFEGVDTAACITLLEGPEAPSVKQVIHAEVSEWPGVQKLLEAVSKGEAATYSWGTIRPITWQALQPRRKWTVIPRENDRFDSERFVPLAQIAHIVRGIATGANNFFVLSDAEAKAWGLHPRNLRPVLTKNREAPGYVFDQEDFEQLKREGKKCWLLYLTGPVQPGTPEERYIRHGEALGLNSRSLVRTRSHWYEMEQREPAPIYFTYLSRKKSRFIYNSAGVLALNVFLCIYPEPRIAENQIVLKALLAVLNSMVSKQTLRHVGRSYGGDTIKLEPRELDRVPVLNLLKLGETECRRLATLFDTLCAANSDEEEDAIRRAIDEMVEAISL